MQLVVLEYVLGGLAEFIVLETSVFIFVVAGVDFSLFCHVSAVLVQVVQDHELAFARRLLLIEHHVLANLAACSHD